MNIFKFFVLFLNFFYKPETCFTMKLFFKYVMGRGCKLRHNANLIPGSLNKPKGARRTKGNLAPRFFNANIDANG